MLFERRLRQLCVVDRDLVDAALEVVAGAHVGADPKAICGRRDRLVCDRSGDVLAVDVELRARPGLRRGDVVPPV
jgi:hypothetical protein